MVCAFYQHSRGVRYFLLGLFVFAVALLYFVFNTQALNNRFLLFESYIGKNERWSVDGLIPSLLLNYSTKSDDSTATAANANDSSSISDMILSSTLFSRLSSELEKRIRLLFHDSLGSTIKNSSRWCPVISPKLIGWTNISAATILEEKDDALQYDMIKNGVEDGGRYEPTECQSRHKLAIVIPIRNRTEHLAVFSRYMHRFLQRQQLSYAIFVVQQSEGSPFNRGMLMNIGFNEAQQLKQENKFQCFFFHDVDLLPENDANPYTCPENGKPRLMSYSLDFWNNYKASPDWHFGGVTALTTTDFQTVNGFSNVYWGWGGEDDDLLQRIKLNNLTATRSLQDYPSLVHMVRYKSLSHAKAQPNPVRYQLLDQGPKRMKSDGLSDLKYKKIDIQHKLLYTYIRVDIQQHVNL